jgi:hypothetical protein
MTRLLVLLLAGLAHAATPVVVLPTYAGSAAATPTATDTLLCATYPAPMTISGTKLAGRFTAGVSGSWSAGFAIYDATGTELGEATSSESGTGAVTISATGLTINLTAGTRYIVCVCTTSTTTRYLGVNDTTGTGRLASMLNAATLTTTVGTAAENCGGTGNPPASITVPLTAASTFLLPIVVVE